MNIITPDEKEIITKGLKIGIVKELFSQNKISQEQYSKLMSMQYQK